VIYFKCKSCGALIKVSDRFAGKKGRCARCGATNDIPPQSERDAVPHRPASAAPPEPAGPAEVSAAEEAPVTVAPSSRPASELPFPAAALERQLGGLRRRAGGLFPAVEKASYLFGVYAVVALSPLLLAAGVAVLLAERAPRWSRRDNVALCVELVVSALLLPLCQYVIAKVRTASWKLIRNSPSSITSPALLDCLAVGLLAAGLAALGHGAYGVYHACQAEEWLGAVLPGLLAAIQAGGCLLLACVALKPEVLNVRVSPRAGAGGEAIGLVSFFLKALLAVAPVALLLLVCGLLVTLAQGGYQAVKAESVRLIGAPAAWVGRQVVLFTAGYVMLYVLFLGYHLLVDLVCAVFEIAVNTRPATPVEGPADSEPASHEPRGNHP